MNVGMLWFDNDPKAEFSTKIERAARYYQNKYGRSPNLCFVHPSMLPANPSVKEVEPTREEAHSSSIRSAGVEVRPAKTVLPNHFWIGINSSPAAD